MNKVVLYDWENDENIEVPLDSNKEPLENANYYFKKYNKMKNKLKGLLERKKVLEDELDYLYQIWYTIEDAESEEEIEEIKFEMQNMGLIKDKKGRSKKVIKSEPRKVEHNGFVIYIGKNNKQNDELVRKANDEDLWFHVHEMPGSHVVLKNNGKDIDEEVIRFAAELAAGYSKGKNSGKVPVDYTKVKYVRKTKGLKPGLVLYSNYKTIYVKPRRIDNV
jgi:predicted ribosome quality control (RQC) complex YloA/Tae2 family protein